MLSLVNAALSCSPTTEASVEQWTEAQRPPYVPHHAVPLVRLNHLWFVWFLLQYHKLQYICYYTTIRTRTRVEVQIDLKVADEVWIAAALLQKEQPQRRDFSIEEIVDRAKSEQLSWPFRKSVYVHVVQHCVANRPPNSGRYRMLFETAPGRRRLFRAGDSYDPSREGAKTIPAREGIPANYWNLLGWYREWNTDDVRDRIKNDPLLALRGSGKHIWTDEHADEYIRRLREGWE